MPGRLSMYNDKAFKAEISSVRGSFKDLIGELHKCYNIAPSTALPIYTNEGLYCYAYFGLISFWAKERGSIQINARSETVFEKSSFKEAYKRRRCLIPVNGYFEWKKDTKGKSSQAYFITSAMGDYFVFAGIYEYWYDNALKKPILTVALLTTEANEKISTIHDRMPVILEPTQWKTWLEDTSTYTELNKILKPVANEKIKYFTVGRSVNSVKNNTPKCVEEIVEPMQMTLF